MTNKNQNLVSVTYNTEQNKDDIFSLLLTYNTYEDSSEFSVNCSTNNIDKFKYVSMLVDYKDSSFLKLYNEVIEDMCTENKLTLKNIKSKIDEEPIVKIYTENLFGDSNISKMTRYLYQNKNENMTINYIDKEKKVGRTIYTQLDNEGYPLLMKSAQIESLNGNDISLNIGTPTDSLEKQEQILKKIIREKYIWATG